MSHNVRKVNSLQSVDCDAKKTGNPYFRILASLPHHSLRVFISSCLLHWSVLFDEERIDFSIIPPRNVRKVGVQFVDR